MPGKDAAEVFAGACGSCHTGAPGAVAIDLAHSTAVNTPDPRNAIRVILAGIAPSPGEPGPMICRHLWGHSQDQQIAELVSYVRARFGHGPPWENLVDKVRAIRTGQEKS